MKVRFVSRKLALLVWFVTLAGWEIEGSWVIDKDSRYLDAVSVG
jgi:hypothetical protein